MSTLPRTFHILTPTFKPVGGVIKIFDYATHALAEGFRISLWCPQPLTDGLPLFNIERFAALKSVLERDRADKSSVLSVGPDDLIFFSLPLNFDVAHRSLLPGMSPERIIHIVQGTRHVTPSWSGGLPLRLLTRPAARIATNDVVYRTIVPYLDSRGFTRVIPLGHDLGYFRSVRRPGFHDPIRVAYTTWKSDVGDHVAPLLFQDDFTFRAIREHVGWEELRDLYAWADVFLCTPRQEEGFYMPGLEAMEAGAIVITPNAGGNMAYCRPNKNCLMVDFNAPGDYARALNEIQSWPEETIASFRDAGWQACSPFDLVKERRLFGSFLEDLWHRIRAFERGLPRGETTSHFGSS